jgi:hypothetical protein
MLRTRIRRHLTNQRTDAVAMSVLDPFDVFEIEVWPLPEFRGTPGKDATARRRLDALERLITQTAVGRSQFKAIMNEKDGRPASLSLKRRPQCAVGSCRSASMSFVLSRIFFRIALITSRLGQVISERKVQGGLKPVFHP